MRQYYQLSAGRLYSCDDMMQNRALSYGDGFFSTIGVYQGQLLWAQYHAERLRTGADAFMLDIDVAHIIDALSKLASDIRQGIIKLIVTRTPQVIRGYGFYHGDAHIYIQSTALPLYDGISFIHHFPIQSAGDAIALGEYIGTRPPRFAGIKLISCHDHVFAHTALLDAQRGRPQLTEALIKNTLGHYISGTLANVFYRLGERWHTPPITHSGVDGVARRALLAHRSDISERILSDDDLPRLSALCFTNAVRGIIPITRLWLDTTSISLDDSHCTALIDSHD